MISQVQLPSWRILIVEDDPLVQLGIEQALMGQSQLSIIDTVEDGYLAVEAALAHKPDLIFMDIGLPGIDGIQVTQQIKAQLPETKVVMLTSHASPTEVMAAFASGAEAYCIKGGSIEVLLTAIATVAQGGIYLDAKIAQLAVQCLGSTVSAASDAATQDAATQNEATQNEATQTAKIAPTVALEHALSERELEVLGLLVEGLSNPEIAEQLFISPNTVKAHMRSLMNKLAANDRVQVAVKALRAGLI
jgi:two-component system, NarL family, response regulator LiaR